MTAALERARRLMAGARRIVVLTGAGISAESGVPTFRGEGGLWRSHRPEDLATPEAFARDPVLVWTWYAWRRSLVAACAPNRGHHALARLARERGARIVTQNVDGLHERVAGAGAEPLALHGHLFGDRCTRCGARTPAPDGPSERFTFETLPRCPAPCGGLLRPDVVWFGEALDAGVLEQAFAFAAEADLCLVVGTSALVHPAASLPLATLEHGGVVIEVNPEATPLSAPAAVSLRGSAGETLPDLVAPEEAPGREDR